MGRRSPSPCEALAPRALYAYAEIEPCSTGGMARIARFPSKPPQTHQRWGRATLSIGFSCGRSSAAGALTRSISSVLPHLSPQYLCLPSARDSSWPPELPLGWYAAGRWPLAGHELPDGIPWLLAHDKVRPAQPLLRCLRKKLARYAANHKFWALSRALDELTHAPTHH